MRAVNIADSAQRSATVEAVKLDGLVRMLVTEANSALEQASQVNVEIQDIVTGG